MCGLLYRLLVRLTTFTLNRAYLLTSLVATLLLPLLPLPSLVAQLLGSAPAPAVLPDFVRHINWRAGAPATAAAAPARATDQVDIALVVLEK